MQSCTKTRVSRFPQGFEQLCGEKLFSEGWPLCHAVSHGAVPLCNVTVGLEVRYPGHLEPVGGTSVGLLSNWHSTLHTLCFKLWGKVSYWAGQIFCFYGTRSLMNVSAKADHWILSWSGWIHFTHWHRISLLAPFNIIPLLCLGLLKGKIISGLWFTTQIILVTHQNPVQVFVCILIFNVYFKPCIVFKI
jgi:hypothetical protein